MKTVDLDNRDVYLRPFVVDHYAQKDGLQEPERSILEFLNGRLSEMRMLDVGVGAGRTAVHFSGRVKEYVGIDYSPEMVSACNQRFSGEKSGRLTFKVCDVREMDCFKDRSFDLILFSFNGIDNLTHVQRLRVFMEFERLCSRNGDFVFSTHNINPLLRVRASRDLFTLIKRGFSCLSLLLKMFLRRYVIVTGEEIGGIPLTYYATTPQEQVKQIQESGFIVEKVFTLKEGKTVLMKDLPVLQDPWLYYLCTPKNKMQY